MNRDDRAALVEQGSKFCPKLFAKLDEGTDDDVILGAVGKAYAQLHAAAEAAQAELAQVKADLDALRSQPAYRVSYGELEPEPVADDQPAFAEVEAWLAQQPLLVTRQRVSLVAQPGGRRQRQYSAYHEAPTMADVLSWRLDDQGLLHVVLSDGQTGRLPWS